MKLLFDFFPVLLFFVAYSLWGMYAATAAAIVAAVAQVSFTWVRHRKIETIHRIMLIIIVVLGGATLIFHDSRIFMWKPTLANWLFATVFLGSHFIGQKPVLERMMGEQIQLPSGIWRRLSWGWTAFFIIMGFANLYVAFYYAPQMDPAQREAIWVKFKVFGMMGMTIAFAVAQAFYLARHMAAEQESP